MSPIRILYDGWPLVNAPNSAAAIHLLTLLAAGGEAVDALVALPSDPPHWLPEGATPLIHATPNEVRAQLAWQQTHLPGLANKHACALIHSTGTGVPLRAKLPVLVSPGENGQSKQGFWGRVGDALGAGGASQALMIYPNDLADFAPEGARLLPPVIHPAFISNRQPLPKIGLAIYAGEYILVHVPSENNVVQKVMDTWSWSAKALAGSFPLVFAHLAPNARDLAEQLARDYQVEDSVQFLPALSISDLAGVYANCTAVYHPCPPSPWGDAVRLGIAAARPVVSYKQADMAAIMGPAGFLVNEDNARKLGGQVIAITVKHNIAEELAHNAQAQSARWSFDTFKDALVKLYQEISTG
jgi:glycosyltransferase involved in cell wall biosynthesis